MGFSKCVSHSWPNVSIFINFKSHLLITVAALGHSEYYKQILQSVILAEGANHNGFLSVFEANKDYEKLGYLYTAWIKY